MKESNNLSPQALTLKEDSFQGLSLISMFKNARKFKQMKINSLKYRINHQNGGKNALNANKILWKN